MIQKNNEKFVDLKQQRDLKERMISKRTFGRLAFVFGFTALMSILLALICGLNGGSLGYRALSLHTWTCAAGGAALASAALFCFVKSK